MKFFRFVLPIIFLVVLVWSILQIPPPKSLVEATFLQIIYFFIPLLLFFSTLLNIFYKNFLKSTIVGFGLTLLVFLRGLGALNLVTAVLTIVSTILVAKSFKNSNFKFPKRNFTSKRPLPSRPEPATKVSSFRRLKLKNPKSENPGRFKLKRMKS